MKILIGIDDSKVSGAVLRAVVTQFRTEHTEVRVLHVLQPMIPAPPEMAAGYAPELEDQKEPARELVERIAKELRSTGFKVDAVVEVGDIRERIIDSAAEWGAGSDRHWFAWTERHQAFLAGQRGRIRRSPCQMLRRNRSRASEYLTDRDLDVTVSERSQGKSRVRETAIAAKSRLVARCLPIVAVSPGC